MPTNTTPTNIKEFELAGNVEISAPYFKDLRPTTLQKFCPDVPNGVQECHLQLKTFQDDNGAWKAKLTFGQGWDQAAVDFFNQLTFKYDSVYDRFRCLGRNKADDSLNLTSFTIYKVAVGRKLDGDGNETEERNFILGNILTWESIKDSVTDNLITTFSWPDK